MTALSAPVAIDCSCEHCGHDLTVTGERSTVVSIKGLRAFTWVHTDSGVAECAMPRLARPFDPWYATRKYEEAVAALAALEAQG